jgi:hypothetical protein
VRRGRGGGALGLLLLLLRERGTDDLLRGGDSSVDGLRERELHGARVLQDGGPDARLADGCGEDEEGQDGLGVGADRGLLVGEGQHHAADGVLQQRGGGLVRLWG